MKNTLRISLLVCAFLLVGAGCSDGGGSTTTTSEKVTLEYWRVFDGEDSFDDIIDDYRSSHSNVKINYTKLRFDEYEDELIRAFAENRGPDIFTIHNTWLNGYTDLIMPMPETITVTEQEVQGSLRQEVVTVSKTKTSMTERTLKNEFVEQVAEDVLLEYAASTGTENRIFGLPLSMDTLGLFYNKDLLNAAGIASPPTTWSDFQNQVELLTAIDDEGNITQSGGALGTSENVERSTDILSLLMMQNGTQMTDSRGRIAFHTIPDDAPEGVFPGLDAVEFYTDFSSPTKTVYTWDETFDGSFEAFVNGETAFFFGYSYHTPLIRTTSPKLNFGITGAPQISGGQVVNYANYWVEVVAQDTEHDDWAWDFLIFASDADNVGLYLNYTDKPTALRSLISSQLDDELIGPFAEQVLTAASWYKGTNAAAAEDALEDLIDNILSGAYEGDDAIDLAASKVSQTF